VQTKKIWTLIGLAGLAIETLIRSDDEVHSSAARQAESAQLKEAVFPPAKIEPPHQGHVGSAWLLLRTDWSAVLWQVYKNLNDNRLLAVAAGVVFYGLLAIFPAVTAFVSLYGLLADPSTIHERLSVARGVLPQGALDILNEQLNRLTAHRSSALSLGFVGGLIVALWSANAGVKAVMDALNVAYGEAEKRSFVRLNLIALAFTLGSIVAIALTLSAVVIAPIVFSQMGMSGAFDWFLSLARWPIVLVLVVVGLTVLYRFGPSLSAPQWTWLFPGNVIAAVIWLIVSAAFSWYIANFGNYDAAYGSLGAAIGMMTWMWISMIVVLLGAELNAEIQRKSKSTLSTS
jgi:membrane protein